MMMIVFCQSSCFLLSIQTLSFLFVAFSLNLTLLHCSVQVLFDASMRVYIHAHARVYTNFVVCSKSGMNMNWGRVNSQPINLIKFYFMFIWGCMLCCYCCCLFRSRRPVFGVIYVCVCVWLLFGIFCIFNFVIIIGFSLFLTDDKIRMKLGTLLLSLYGRLTDVYVSSSYSRNDWHTSLEAHTSTTIAIERQYGLYKVHLVTSRHADKHFECITC